MAKHLYIKLQNPVVELEVKAKDPTGKEEKILVGFKRYEIKKSQEKVDEFMALVNKETVLNFADLNLFIRGEVVYLKNISFEVEENGKVSPLTVKDTREETKREDLWEDSVGCLDILVDSFLSSAPWRMPFITTLQKALLNADLDSLNIKN